MKKMKAEKKDYRIFIYTALALIIILGILILNIKSQYNMPNETRGTFGDMFGFSNALFSGLAFAGIIVTILLQMKELKAQREDLKDQKKETEAHNKTIRVQRFENTFFQLLGIHHNIVENTDKAVIKYEFEHIKEYEEDKFKHKLEEYLKTYTTGNLVSSFNIIEECKKNNRTILKGRYVFKKMYEIHLKDKIVDEITQISFFGSSTLKTDEEILGNETDIFGNPFNESFQSFLNNKYDGINEEVRAIFGHYYRNLYRIFKFINQQEFYSYDSLKDLGLSNNLLQLNNKQKVYEILNHTKRYEYTSMVRAQLSDYELWWLSFNCMWDSGIKFKNLAEKYVLLKNHPFPELMNELCDKGLFKTSSYLKEDNNNIFDFEKYQNISQAIKVNEDGEINLDKEDLDYFELGIIINEHYYK